MLLAFWNNPEFIRHRRADLRVGRAAACAALVSVVCWLTGMSVWSGSGEQHKNFYPNFYTAVLIMQGAVLVLWTFLACTQAVVKERDQKTYDFLRTTRLSSAELMIGKLFGAPVVGYFIFLCFMPITVVVGLLAHISIGEMAETFLIVIVFALVMGLFALVLSVKAEKSTTGLAIFGVLMIYMMLMSTAFTSNSDKQGHDLMPGIAALSPLTALAVIHSDAATKETQTLFFSAHISWVMLTLLLHCMFGAWFVLMLTRNLKTDFEEILLLNRWQLLGFVAFLNFLFYGFLNPQAYYGYTVPVAAADIAMMAVGLNLFAVAMVGLLSITPTLHFRGWYRLNQEGEIGYLAESGPPWPWLILAALLGYMFLTVAAFALSPTFPLQQWKLGEVAGWMIVGLVFILRDVLFLQLLSLSHMKRAAMKGVLLLGLYYAGVMIVASVLTGGVEDPLFTHFMQIFTPFAAMADKAVTWSMATIAGLVLQMAISGYIIHLTNQRLARKAVSPPILAGAQEA